MLTVAPSMFSLWINMAVHEWRCLSGRSVEGFQDLPRQFRQVLSSKSFNRCDILLVGLGGPTRINIWFYKEGIGRVLCSCYGGFTQNSLRAATRDWLSQWRNGWSTASRNCENKPCSRIPRSGLKAVCCWSRFLIFEQDFPLKKWRQRSALLGVALNLTKRSSRLEFVAKSVNGIYIYCSRNMESSCRSWLVIGVKLISWHYEHILITLWPLS